MKTMAISAFSAIALFGAMVRANANGPFVIPGGVLFSIREDIAALPGLANGDYSSVENLRFTFDPITHTLDVFKGNKRISSALVNASEPLANPQTLGFTISGQVAFAIVRGIDQRSIPVHARLLRQESSGQFVISGYYPYDDENAVAFNEVFPPAASAPTPGPHALDSCWTSISYVVRLPSYESKKPYIRYCGSE